MDAPESKKNGKGVRASARQVLARAGSGAGAGLVRTQRSIRQWAGRTGEAAGDAAFRFVNAAQTTAHITVDLAADKLFRRLTVREDASAMEQPPETLARTDVFVIHGHDLEALAEVKSTLLAWGLTPISLAEQAGALMTIKEKFEAHAYSESVGFALALFTPDDECIGSDGSGACRRARQNVVFELGFFLSAFQGERTCILVKGDVELPSDINGISKVDMDSPHWKSHLKAELRLARVELNPRKAKRQQLPPAADQR